MTHLTDIQINDEYCWTHTPGGWTCSRCTLAQKYEKLSESPRTATRKSASEVHFLLISAMEPEHLADWLEKGIAWWQEKAERHGRFSDSEYGTYGAYCAARYGVLQEALSEVRALQEEVSKHG